MNLEHELKRISDILDDIKELLEKYYHDKRFDRILNNLERTEHNVLHLSKKVNEIDNRTLYHYPKMTPEELEVIENV